MLHKVDCRASEYGFTGIDGRVAPPFELEPHVAECDGRCLRADQRQRCAACELLYSPPRGSWMRMFAATSDAWTQGARRRRERLAGWVLIGAIAILLGCSTTPKRGGTDAVRPMKSPGVELGRGKAS